MSVPVECTRNDWHLNSDTYLWLVFLLRRGCFLQIKLDAENGVRLIFPQIILLIYNCQASDIDSFNKYEKNNGF